MSLFNAIADSHHQQFKDELRAAYLELSDYTKNQIWSKWAKPNHLRKSWIKKHKHAIIPLYSRLKSRINELSKSQSLFSIVSDENLRPDCEKAIQDDELLLALLFFGVPSEFYQLIRREISEFSNEISDYQAIFHLLRVVLELDAYIPPHKEAEPAPVEDASCEPSGYNEEAYKDNLHDFYLSLDASEQKKLWLRWYKMPADKKAYFRRWIHDLDSVCAKLKSDIDKLSSSLGLGRKTLLSSDAAQDRAALNTLLLNKNYLRVILHTGVPKEVHLCCFSPDEALLEIHKIFLPYVETLRARFKRHEEKAEENEQDASFYSDEQLDDLLDTIYQDFCQLPIDIQKNIWGNLLKRKEFIKGTQNKQCITCLRQLTNKANQIERTKTLSQTLHSDDAQIREQLNELLQEEYCLLHFLKTCLPFSVLSCICEEVELSDEDDAVYKSIAAHVIEYEIAVDRQIEQLKEALVENQSKLDELLQDLAQAPAKQEELPNETLPSPSIREELEGTELAVQASNIQVENYEDADDEDLEDIQNDEENEHKLHDFLTLGVDRNTIYQSSFCIKRAKISILGQLQMSEILSLIYDWISTKEERLSRSVDYDSFVEGCNLVDTLRHSYRLETDYFHEEEEEAWFCTYTHKGSPASAGQYWTTNIGLRQGDAGINFFVRVYYTYDIHCFTQAARHQHSSLPRFVKSLLESPNYELSCEHAILHKHCMLTQSKHAKQLIEHVSACARYVPQILIYNQKNQQNVERATKLSDALRGKANVFFIYDLEQEQAPDCVQLDSCTALRHGDAILLFQSHDAGLLHQHRFDYFDKKQATLIVDRLCSNYPLICEGIISSQNELEELERQHQSRQATEQLKAELAKAQEARATLQAPITPEPSEGATCDEAALAELQAQYAKLENDFCEEIDKQEQLLEQAKARYEAKIDKLQAKLDNPDYQAWLDQKYGHSDSFLEDESEYLFDLPTLESQDLGGVALAAKEHLSNLIISERALKAASEFDMPNLQVAWTMLHYLNSTFHEQYCAEGSSGNFLSELTKQSIAHGNCEQRFRYAKGEGPNSNRNREITRDRTVTVEGEEIICKAHLKFERNFRIYFGRFKDKIYILSIGPHLDNASTNKDFK